MTHPPFLCTAWNKAVADSPPAVQEMSVSLAALQSEEGEKDRWKRQRAGKTMALTYCGRWERNISLFCTHYYALKWNISARVFI